MLTFKLVFFLSVRIDRLQKEKEMKRLHKREIDSLRVELARHKQSLSIPDDWYNDKGMATARQRLHLETVTQALTMVCAALFVG